MNPSPKTNSWIDETQNKIVNELVDWFNGKIETNQENGHVQIREQATYFQNELRRIIREYFLDSLGIQNISVETGYVIDTNGKPHFMHVIIRKKLQSEDAILAVVKVNSYADLTRYTEFKVLLQACGLVNKGFYVGIAGAMRDLMDGENQNLNPKAFLLAKTENANVKEKIRMEPLHVYNGVLQHFLDALGNQAKK